MKATHLEILVEEPSMEAFLRTLLPNVVGDAATFEVYSYQGKHDLIGKLDARLRGYAKWLPPDWRIVVLLDRDDNDCIALKRTMEQAARNAPLQTRSAAGRSLWQVVNRIAIEELEAWYFGDWAAVRSAYPRVNKTIAQQSAYRNPDAVAGGTWEAFETTLRRSGYFKGGLRKIEVARELGSRIVPSRNISPSFAVFWHAIKEAMLPA